MSDMHHWHRLQNICFLMVFCSITARRPTHRLFFIAHNLYQIRGFGGSNEVIVLWRHGCFQIILDLQSEH